VNEDEIYNNPNLHSKEQEELEIPDGLFILKNHNVLIVGIYFFYRWILNYFKLKAILFNY
jgi:hypothetical protein